MSYYTPIPPSPKDGRSVLRFSEQPDDATETLEDAILAMARVDDGAITKDSQGFNKRDVGFFSPHIAFAKAGKQIPSPVRTLVVKRLQKYSAQLFELGINFNMILAEEGVEDGGSVGAGSKDEGLPKMLADAVLQQYFFAQDGGGRLYRYRKGVYIPKAEEFIRQSTQVLLEDWRLSNKWSSHLANEVVEYIRVSSPVLWDRPRDDVINVKNGLLNVSTRDLTPHLPEFLSPIQLPTDYDPGAKCPAIDLFISQVFPEDALDLAYEILGTAMIPGEAQDQAVLLLGPGGNGKSAYLGLVRNFLGRTNTCAVPLHRLESDRFSVSRLVGKLANICSDLPSEHLADTIIFKSITGRDPVPAEYKYRDSFDLAPYVRLVFSANEPPRSRDTSEAFFDRWLVVPFTRTFRGTDRELPRNELDARLSHPWERSGLLNRALDGLDRFRANGYRYSSSPSTETALRDFRNVVDPLAIWLQKNTVEIPQKMVVKGEILKLYNRDCARDGRIPATEEGFSRALVKLRPNIKSSRRRVNGRLEHVWLGLSLQK